ncbi:MAG: DUF2652 domain-containing protein [Anaerolineales bacterium]
MSKTHEGFLLIADINGYTRYLSESELEHAQETLTALLELLVANTRPPLVISRLAGDAVISYGLREDFFQGQSFIEKIEDIYVTFRKAIERLVLNNTCRCNACANISSLDLKFFIHYGTFGIQHISDHDELVGSDINLLHRLLKNSVTEATGLRAYALYTDEAVRHLDVGDPGETMTPHLEAYEYLGEVRVWAQDMHAVWEEKRSATKVDFPQERIWGRFEVRIDMPRERVWDYLIQPRFRTTLVGADRASDYPGVATLREHDRKGAVTHVPGSDLHQRILSGFRGRGDDLDEEGYPAGRTPASAYAGRCVDAGIQPVFTAGFRDIRA